MLTAPFAEGAHPCYAAHDSLGRAAVELAKLVDRHAPEGSDLLRLGAACVRLSAQRALAARDPCAALRAWNDCAPGERQIRLATYRLLSHGNIGVERYDELFRLAHLAARAREGEQLRLRRELRELCAF